MPAERYFIELELNKDAEVQLEGLEFHHLTNVMRSKEGDIIEVINGQNALAIASILRIEKKRALLRLKEVKIARTISHQIILAQALPRLNRLDFIIEKGTELGMTDLWLFAGERSERKELSESQFERLKSITIAAAKQCGRLDLPRIVMKPPLSQWTTQHFPLYFGDVATEAPFFLSSFDKSCDPKIIFCTGPETGFSKNEEQYLKNIGALGVKLHSNILRTDTASIAALSLISHYLN